MAATQPLYTPPFNDTVEVRVAPVRGRGVFATRDILKGTLVDVSPVLLFNDEEYSAHGKHTVLDHYTYRWRGGYALALGLGSIFNHSASPNTGFLRDMDKQTISYITLRDVPVGSELYICYGSSLWFDDAVGEGGDIRSPDDSEEEDDAHFLSRLQLDDAADDAEEEEDRADARRGTGQGGDAESHSSAG